MADKDKLKEKIKEGVSVEEIEKFARKYTNEVFLILSLIIATISSIFDFFTSSTWSVFFAGLCAILAIALPTQIGKLLQKLMQMQAKTEKSVVIIIGVVRLVIGLFIPFILFAEIGLLGGHYFHLTSRKSPSKEENKTEDTHL